MKIIFYFASFIVCFLSLNCFAQKKQNVYFLKDDGQYVAKKEDANFVRIVQEPDSGSVLFNVLEYYPNGNLKTIGKSSTVEPIYWQGSVNSYYPNKKKKQIARIEKKHFSGPVYDYYPNGKLYRSVGLSHNSYPVIAENLVFEADEFVYSVNDTTGTATVTGGNGYYKKYDQDFKYVKEEGAVNNNKRHGIWKGFSGNGQLIFTEEFAEGKFLKGTRTNEKGDTIKYTIKEALPTYEGTKDGFNRYLANTVSYPKPPMPQNILGTEIVSFIVDQFGDISSIKILKSIYKDVDDEIIKTFKAAKKWKPAIQNGITRPVEIMIAFDFLKSSRIVPNFLIHNIAVEEISMGAVKNP